ncbi:thiamine phosphate synthase [Paenibacillus sp. y28]|uniref:thiamine phosphate synthase n=1 Tax=Paenibacillus sp. y28 TaxID=3129110 RepID=UPI00301ABD10
MTNEQTQLRGALAVYLVMGLQSVNGKTALGVAKEALEGGITMLQLREKHAPLRQVLREGRAIRELCRSYNVPFLVNDRIDVAMLLEADGVHVGQDDIPASEARSLLGPQAIIGMSAGTEEEVHIALQENPDYLGIGPIYATATKGDAGAPIGTRLLEWSQKQASLPMVGIGGITAGNAGEVITAGADGVAVVSAITAAGDPGQAASKLRSIVHTMLLR